MVFNYNPFHILGINKNASNAEIKKAFKNIALKCHPDKLVNIKDEKIKNEKIEKFKNASIAYNLLINNKFDFHSDYIDDKYNVDFDLNDD
jgi:DnaJ like chaperone protein